MDKSLDYLSDEELEKIANQTENFDSENRLQLESSDPGSTNGGFFKSFGNSLKDILGGAASGLHQNLKAFSSDPYYRPEEKVFFGDKNSFPFKVGSVIGEYGPQFIPAIKGAQAARYLFPKLGQAASQAIGAGLSGALFSPGNLYDRSVSGAEQAALVGGAMKSVDAAKYGKKYYNNMMPSRFEKKFDRQVNELIKGKEPTRENFNTYIYDRVNQAGNLAKKESKFLYDNVEDLAAKSGYNGFSKKINNPFVKNAPLLKLINGNNDLKFAYKEFRKNPSYKNAHELQRLINERAYELKDGGIISGQQFKKLIDARKSLISNIESSFNNGGNPELSDLYKGAAFYYETKYLPYKSTRQLKDILESKPFVERKDPSGVLENYTKFKYPSGDPLKVFDKNSGDALVVAKSLDSDAKKVLFSKILEGYKNGGKYDFDTIKSLPKKIELSNYKDIVSGEYMDKLNELIQSGQTGEFPRKILGSLKKLFKEYATKQIKPH